MLGVKDKVASPNQSKTSLTHQRSHFTNRFIMNVDLNVCLDEFWVNFENGSLGVKKIGHHAKLKESLVYRVLSEVTLFK